MSVYRSLQNIYVQLIDDDSGKTLCEANTRNVQVRDSIGYGGNIKAAQALGEAAANIAKAEGISSVIFDRCGYIYHGRIKAFAESARKNGLSF